MKSAIYKLLISGLNNLPFKRFIFFANQKFFLRTEKSFQTIEIYW